VEDNNDKPTKVPAGVWIFHTVWVTAAVIGIAANLLKDSPNKYGYLQTVILALTLIGLGIYTAYTRRMQQAMVRQTNVGLLPVFEVKIIRKGEHDSYAGVKAAVALESWLRLKNIGNGTALNVQIESTFVTCFGNLAAHNYLPLKFEKVFSIAKDEGVRVKDTQPFDVSTAHYEGEERPDLLGFLFGCNAWEDSELKIWFTDILGNEYVQVIHLGRRGIWPDVVQRDDGRVTRTIIEYNRKRW
jgi:hypothetical protein